MLSAFRTFVFTVKFIYKPVYFPRKIIFHSLMNVKRRQAGGCYFSEYGSIINSYPLSLFISIGSLIILFPSCVTPEKLKYIQNLLPSIIKLLGHGQLRALMKNTKFIKEINVIPHFEVSVYFLTKNLVEHM